MLTLAVRRRPKDRRTTGAGASAGVINMDDIAAERREGGGGRGSAAHGERGSESLPMLAWELGWEQAAVPWGTKFHCLSFFPDKRG